MGHSKKNQNSTLRYMLVYSGKKNYSFFRNFVSEQIVIHLHFNDGFSLTPFTTDSELSLLFDY